MRGLLLAIIALLGFGAPPAAALPVIRIDTAGPIRNDPKVPARLQMPGYRGQIGIELRGQSSQRLFPKKSYALELRTAQGKDRKTPLLGMPADGDWVLYGPYNDKTLMRNVVAYATTRAIGRYAPRTRFAELRLNGRYQGVYVLIEKVELGDDRVRGEALFEFTFPLQARSKAPSFRTPLTRRPVVWEDPERGDLSPGRARALADRVRAAERALYGRASWRRHIDEASAVDYALINELFKNQDAFHASTFMALHADGKLRFGPVWDFDISSGNSDYGRSRRMRGWMLPTRDWAERLYRDRAFTQRLARRWRALRADGLRRKVLAAVEQSQTRLRGAVSPNFRRWPVLDRRIWPNPRVHGSYRAELRFLRSWLNRRIGWIDRNIGRL